MQIEIETVDKTGTFLGSAWEGKENVSIALLEAGLAKLHPSFSTDRVTEGHLLLRAEESAKKKNLKVGGVCGDGVMEPCEVVFAAMLVWSCRVCESRLREGSMCVLFLVLDCCRMSGM